MTEWREVSLGDLGRIVTGTTPPANRPEWFGTELPFITPSDIDGMTRTVATARFLSSVGAAALAPRLLPADAVCFVCIGATIGKVCMTTEPSISNQQINAIVTTTEVDPRFLFYALRWNAPIIATTAGGAATPIINKSAFAATAVVVPGLLVQKRIADVLASFDNLIENNRRRMEILEETARSLYREWFVRYRFPGHESAEFVGSPLGLIPCGWTMTTLGEQLDFVMGQSPPSTHYNDDAIGLPFHQGVGSYGRRYPRHQRWSARWTREAGTGDILVSVRAPVGRINVADRRLALGRGLAAARPRDGLSSYWLETLKHVFRKEDAFGGGTIFKAVTRSDLLRIEHIVAAEQIRRDFESRVRPLSELDQQLDEQNRGMEAARDLLLPKLVTGIIDVDSLGVDDVFGWAQLLTEAAAVSP